ncbi:MAG: carbamate kinase [Nitrososphaerota archaeon]|jgi:carbamate kinase|nr:carbamate kinase [Nitrososphaerota archaeon]MDG7038745.1 carbamate kinase [Nitrososphaerota archaeon]
MAEKNLIVIALGGNALQQKGEKGSFEEQYNNVKQTSKKIADLIERGYKVVITHGNGPQVGSTMLRHDAGKKLYDLPPYPMDACGAETQGMIGYMICQALRNELKSRHIDKYVVSIVTRDIVDENDPAFKNPSKPVGPFYTKEEADKYKQQFPDFVYKEDAGRGWRRVVPSPDPKIVAERLAIKTLIDAGFIVVANGGGGIPVVEIDGITKGVDAVIDKDLGGQRLATLLGASKFIILTDVDAAALNYNTPQQQKLGRITVEKMKEYYDQGHFKAGSMGPKVLASIRFVESGGEESIIAQLSQLSEAIEGKVGTHIITPRG